MQLSGIPRFIGRAFGSLRTGASTWMNVAAAAALAASAAYRIYLALTADRISVFRILPAHGEMGTYNDMAANRYIDTVTGPLYPFFLMFIRFFNADGGFRAVFVIQGLAIVLCAASAGVIASRLSSRTAGLAALVIVSAYLPYILYGLVSLPVVFCILIVFLMMLVLSADKGDGEWDTPGSVVSGILGGAALLLHPVMIYLLPGLFAAVKKRMLMASIILVIVVPWGVRNSVMAGRPVPVYESTAYELSGGETVRSVSGWKVIDNVYFNVSFIMKKSLERAHMPVLFGKRSTNKHVLEYAFVLAALLGLAGLIRYSDKKQSRMLLPTASYVILTMLVTRYTTRSRVILEPALLIYAGLTIHGILKWIRSYGNGNREEET